MLPTSLTTAVDEIFTRFREERRLPGASWGVVFEGSLAHSGSAGMADLEAGRAAASSSVFRIASMSKSFTAACVLLLRDEGALSLEDRAERYVPELSGLRYPSSDSPPLTIRLLLSMSSGLVEDDPWADRQLDLPAGAFGELLAGGIGFDLDPGTAFEYSNLGYAILGRIASVAAGMPVQELARRRLFEPLGMSSTTWDADRVAPDVVAIGYRSEHGSFVAEPSLADGAFGPMGGIASSVEDLARWVGLHLSAWPPRDGPETGPLRRASLREMAQAASLRRLPGLLGALPAGAPPDAETDADPALDCYGFGLATFVERDGARSVGHSGGLPGFGSHMHWLPAHGLGVVGLANRTYAPMRLAVCEALRLLRDSGSAPPRRSELSAGLAQARDVVTRCYESGEPELAAGDVLASYVLDRDDNRRPPDFARLRAEHGACLEVEQIQPTGRLRGSWRMHCERATLEVTVMLGPTLPHQIQFLVVRPVT
ncbi:MAG TPA: serine hydrolase domain-containing protein [Acidimicrobiales bacterium]|nr:serine hydrolase domain-containing protein [Acidimicrobiales bacterium]